MEAASSTAYISDYVLVYSIRLRTCTFYSIMYLYILSDYVLVHSIRLCTCIFYPIMCLYILPDNVRMERLQHAVEMYINEITLFKCCVCLDINRNWLTSTTGSCYLKRKTVKISIFFS